jgi:gamma-glutamyltranspeptidase/glutathione hydrolase
MQSGKITAVLTVLIFWGCSENTGPERTTGLVTGSAMVVSAHPLASEVGKNILKKGGNAVDAAIATQFALAVVYPGAGNLGGGGFMLARFSDGYTDALDYREKAPVAANSEMYLGETGEPIANKSLRGHLASGVPGTVAGLAEAHHKYGKLPWHELVQPAVDLAANGFPLTEREASGLNSIQEDLRNYNTVLPEHLMGNWSSGDTIKHRDLSYTLERIRDTGRDGFYSGKIASLLIEEMKRGGGIISMEDLSNYTAVWRKPLEATYRGFKVISMPPPSSGGILLFQMLHAVEPFPLSKWGFNDEKTVHLMVEAQRRAYADRAYWLGDPDFKEIPVKQLIDENYVKARMSDFDEKKATSSELIKEGKLFSESEETTHLSVVDAQGNAVAVTTTLNGGYGSRVVVSGAGYLLNNEMDDFSVKPGAPNLYGAIGGEANKIEPGKRMLSSMTPTILEKDGKLTMVVGTPGGTTIITSVFQTILNVVDHGMTMQEAVSVPRFHSQWVPDIIFHEPGAFKTKDSLKLLEIGHVLKSRTRYGAVDAIRILRDGKLEGGADPRGDDKASGY